MDRGGLTKQSNAFLIPSILISIRNDPSMHSLSQVWFWCPFLGARAVFGVVSSSY